MLKELLFHLGYSRRTPYRPPDVVPYWPRHRRLLFMMSALAVFFTAWWLLNDLVPILFQRWPVQFESRGGHMAVWWLSDWNMPGKFELSFDRGLRPTETEPVVGEVGTAFSPTTGWRCSIYMISMPHWTLAVLGWLLVLVLAAWTWRAGHCTQCGYVLLVTSPHRPCPECGARYSRS